LKRFTIRGNEAKIIPLTHKAAHYIPFCKDISADELKAMKALEK
jgi:hypothetical protein